jgi:hypothetical protein
MAKIDFIQDLHGIQQACDGEPRFRHHWGRAKSGRAKSGRAKSGAREIGFE